MARPKQAYLGVFENMDFPAYKFEEYPKVVGYRDDKRTVPILVNDAREEVEFISQGAPGAVKSREEELADEKEKMRIELELARNELEQLKAKQELQAKPEKK